MMKNTIKRTCVTQVCRHGQRSWLWAVGNVEGTS
jgi:hypothetical protein